MSANKKTSPPKKTSPASAAVEVDFWRQLDIFAPSEFKTPITVIGAGATGSYVVWLLAKMGCRDITVYDFDKVENFNLPNQVFGLSDVGALKVEALARRIKEDTGIEIKPVAKPFTTGELKGIVFVLTDTMESRALFWKKSLRYNVNVDLLIETRMAAEGGLIYAINPSEPRQVDEYEKTLYSDEKAEESPCSRRAIAPTVALLSGMAVFTMINFINGKRFHNQTLISLCPPTLFTKNFN